LLASFGVTHNAGSVNRVWYVGDRRAEESTMADDRILTCLLLLPFAGCAVVAFIPDNRRHLEAWLAALIALSSFFLVCISFPMIADGAVRRVTFEWLPSLGVNFTLRMDGFAWLFSMLIVAIGFLVVLYARYYMAAADPLARFFSLLLGFMGSMLGIVLSGNLIQIVFFWELTSVFSFLLIGYWHQSAKARDGARMALIVTAAGGLCLLLGFLIVGHIVGSYEIDAVLTAGNRIRAHPLYLPALILILLGAMTKSAQAPFHFWLPQAMTAPTPVSAYLHSATMVKAGVFLLVRLWPAMGGTDAWFWILGTIGLATFTLGAYLAIFQEDLKGLLAYSTISHLGLITLLIGLDRPLGIVAAIFHMMNHATFKASLFMATGIIDHETGTRDIRRLSGLYRLMPVTATLAMVAAASMAGVPLLNGFLSKEMFFAETIAYHVDSVLDDALPYIVTIGAMFSVTYSLRFIHGGFFGPPSSDLPRMPPPLPSWMVLPVALLVSACLLVGIVPAATAGPLLAAAVTAVLGSDVPSYSLRVWHGFTFPLLMSAAALAGGLILYRLLQPYLRRGMDSPLWLPNINSLRLFDRCLVFLSWRAAKRAIDLLGTRRLQTQLRMLAVVALLAAGWPISQEGLRVSRPLSEIDPVLTIVWVVGAICAAAAAHLAKYHRLAALICMSGAGLAVSLTFAWLSAPDLALTQLLVEIVTGVLLLLGLRWLPKRLEVLKPKAKVKPLDRFRRTADALIAILAGSGIAAIAYAVMTRPLPDSISRFFLERAYTEGGGTNVINVILVDFRAFDTLGEITVLGVVALTVYAVLRRFRPAADSVQIVEPQREQASKAHASLMVPAMLIKILFPFVLLVAVYLLLRGHNLPGGGFVAGLTVSVAIILQYMAGGIRWVESRLLIRPVLWIGLGILGAALTGIGACLAGYPFLTSYFALRNVALLGEIPVSSALIFDVGVFALVVGATVLILVALAHQTIRSHKLSREGIKAVAGEP
jgi:multicomponent K+:H+ antiporter subunit A